jgi:hypothetical protein
VAAESALRLIRYPHALFASVLTESLDACSLCDTAIVVRRVLVQLEVRQSSNDQDFVVVDGDSRGPRVPPVRQPAGKPCLDLGTLLSRGALLSRAKTSAAATNPSWTAADASTPSFASFSTLTVAVLAMLMIVAVFLSMSFVSHSQFWYLSLM